MQVVQLIYEVTRQFPEEEKFGLVNQMRRAAVSIPSNIAEGYRRVTRKDYIRFVRIAFGSASELETQVEISKRLKFGSEAVLHDPSSLLSDVQRMLHRLAIRLGEGHNPQTSDCRHPDTRREQTQNAQQGVLCLFSPQFRRGSGTVISRS